jgi:hypothetical protein
VLILGFGGGSAARIVRALAPRAVIVGVERDAAVLRAAREHFDLDEIGVQIVESDALRYLGRTRPIRKPDWLPTPGLARAARHVARGGILVSNTIDETADVAAEMRRLSPATLGIEIEEYDNRVVVGGPSVISGRLLRAAVAHDRVLSSTMSRLRFRRLSARPR